MTGRDQASRDAPVPSFAERARTLVHTGRIGTLASHSHRVPGFPFGSVAPYGVDPRGCPTFLFSTMAMHTQNLLADGRASLLVAEPETRDDSLAVARVTLLGSVVRLAGADSVPVRDEYLRRHQNARHWASFGDFAFYRLEVADLYYVAGFGAMGWVDAAEYHAAQPDPLAEAAESILAHMNADHREALRLCCRAFAGMTVDDATMTAVDRLGFRVHAQVAGHWKTIRIAFPREVRSPEATRAALVEMVRQAREQSKAAPG